MDVEVTAVVEEENKEKRGESCAESEVVELGKVSGDTQGVGGWWYDPGGYKQF